VCRCRVRARGGRVAEEEDERHSVKHPEEAAAVEGGAPAQGRGVGHITAEAADNHAAVNGHLVQPDGAGASAACVVIRDERQRRRHVERFTDAHERAGHEQLVEACYVPGPPGHRRPHKQACADRETPAEPVGEVAADGAQERIHPLELPEHEAPVLLGADGRNIRHHGIFHRREHLAVEVVE